MREEMIQYDAVSVSPVSYGQQSVTTASQTDLSGQVRC